VVAHRVSGEKVTHTTSAAVASIASLLDDAQKALFDVASRFLDENTHEIESYDSFREGIDSVGGFWQGAWCGDAACEDKVKADTSATIRVLPIDVEDPGAPCAVCGRPGVEKALWAKAY
jgi:prolyl-tRNA synthetase